MDVEALVRPVVESAGLELWEATFRKESGRMVLRVVVDRDGDDRASLAATLEPVPACVQPACARIGAVRLGVKIKRAQNMNNRERFEQALTGFAGTILAVTEVPNSEKLVQQLRRIWKAKEYDVARP